MIKKFLVKLTQTELKAIYNENVANLNDTTINLEEMGGKKKKKDGFQKLLS